MEMYCRASIAFAPKTSTRKILLSAANRARDMLKARDKAVHTRHTSMLSPVLLVCVFGFFLLLSSLCTCEQSETFSRNRCFRCSSTASEAAAESSSATAACERWRAISRAVLPLLSASYLTRDWRKL